MGNIFGKLFRLASFGESHGPAIGGVIEGCPAGLYINMEFVQNELDKRRPGQVKYSTERKESDTVRFLSGIFEGKTTGTPIAFTIQNLDQQPVDYEYLKNILRPSSADYTYLAKYGIRDYHGGGRASARETAVRVAAGAVAKLFLKQHKIEIRAWVDSIGTIRAKSFDFPSEQDIYSSGLRCPDPEAEKKMEAWLDKIIEQGDTAGGTICGAATGVPAGLGEPVFDKLQADLAKAMLSINACKGFEYGIGFRSAELTGSEQNDLFTSHHGGIHTVTNNSGGIQGGISNGERVYFRAAFKAVSSVKKLQKTVDNMGEPVEYTGSGRHDPCVIPRAVPIVEAMTALVLADHLLLNRSSVI